MGYFDGLADASFKKDTHGNNLFYPWGAMGSGYIIDSEEKKNQIRNFLKKMYMIILSVIFLLQIVIGYWINIIFLVFYIVWYYFYVAKITQGLQKTDIKLKASEAYSNSARSHNLATLIVFELISIGFVAVGFWILRAEGGALIGYSSIIFFGICAIVMSYMIITKVRSK